MFEAAEKAEKISRKEFESAVEELRPQLLSAQFALKQKRRSAIVIVDGVDGAGKGEVVHRLNEWLDPRGVDTHAFWESSDEEEQRPYYWRFWRRLPARRHLSILFGSWYARPHERRADGEADDAGFERELDRIRAFEEMLVADGTIIVKLWFHLSKKLQRERLTCLEEDPRTRWRVLASDWRRHAKYDRYAEAAERMVARTHSERAPWHVIEALDRRATDLTAARKVCSEIQRRLEEKDAVVRPSAKRRERDWGDALSRVDLSQRIESADYKEPLADYQARLERMAWKARERGLGCVLVFEGWDAAGKGGAIRRATQAMDPRLFHLYSIAAPSKEELAQHYLWRFWKVLAKDGKMTIYDRSWYGRVLVERVEKLAREDEWERAYDEINEFEDQLIDHGRLVFKFWLHIDKDEQLRRFKAREKTPHKRHKITDEDWRNREKWDDYEHAVNEMIARTHSPEKPWTVVAANQKKFARIQVLRTICEGLEARLK